VGVDLHDEQPMQHEIGSRTYIVADVEPLDVDGVRFGEGPVWCDDGTAGSLVVTSVCDGVLWRIDVASGAKSLVADVDGGANGAALCADGGFLVTQNGGVDFSKFPIWGEEEPPTPRHATPGLQALPASRSVGRP